MIRRIITLIIVLASFNSFGQHDILEDIKSFESLELPTSFLAENTAFFSLFMNKTPWRVDKKSLGVNINNALIFKGYLLKLNTDSTLNSILIAVKYDDSVEYRLVSFDNAGELLQSDIIFAFYTEMNTMNGFLTSDSLTLTYRVALLEDFEIADFKFKERKEYYSIQKDGKLLLCDETKEEIKYYNRSPLRGYGPILVPVDH